MEAGPGEARYGDGRLTLVFHAAPTAPSPGPAVLGLEAPSSGAVRALRASLARTHPHLLPEGPPGPDVLTFSDPAGLRWRYAALAR